jgi:hypothetical protein
MIGLVTTLVSTMGAAGMGSVLKIVAGAIDRFAAAREMREKRKLAAEIGKGKIDVAFQEQVFGNNAGGMYARVTRRTLAIIGMLNLATISILCTIWPSVPLVTFIPPANQQNFTILWGLFKFPLAEGATVVITTGHLALSTVTILAAIVGFYFTPGGRN